MDFTTVVSDLSNAANTIMDPFSNPEKRFHAHNLCEEFKNNSPYCVQCGLLLCSKENPAVSRHLGFQLIEHSIKLRWNNMKPDEKQFIKENVLQILSSGTNNLLNEAAHIKAVLTRIVVEMIKREWPQQWPNMLQELNDICSLGETQKELVLLIFLHFAEDLNNSTGIPPRRKKDLYDTLTSNLKTLFAFFLSSLTQHYGQYIEMKNSESLEKQTQALVHRCVCRTTLMTLGGFLEWVPWDYITIENNLLLRILCTLLGDLTLCQPAINCLLLLVGRKGKVEDRLPLLVLFDKDAMDALFAAASSVSENILQQGETRYVFLKSLCQVLVELGIQLAVLWDTCDDVEQPPTFELYLSGILTFTRHPSLVLNYKTTFLWFSFFQHSSISKNILIHQLIPEIVKIFGEKLIMVGVPSKMDSPSCEFSQFDFDSDENFIINYSMFRSKMLEVLRFAAHLLPELVFNFGGKEFLNLLNIISDGSVQSSDSPELCIKLEAVATYLECVCKRLFYDDNLKLCKTEGIAILTVLLHFKTEDPVMLQPYLSCMSATFFFLAEVPEIIPAVLEKLFNAVVFMDGKNIEITKGASRSIRRHACACIFNVCKVHTKLLLPFFDKMYHHVKILREVDNLGFLERCLLIESLVTLSNEFHSYEKQSFFIKEIVMTIEEKWLKLTREMSGVTSLMTIIGLKEPPKPLSVMDEYAVRRLHIIECVNTIMSIVRRCRIPEDREIAKNCGFFHNGNARSPAAIHVLPLLEGIFAFIKCVNGLHEPASRSQFHPEYSDILEMPDAGKNMIMGIAAYTAAIETSDDTNSLFSQPKIKNIIHYLYESSSQLLTHVVQTFGVEFYTMNGLSSLINLNLFSSLEDLPDFKLKLLFHNFLKPFIRFCPSSCHHVLVPIFQHLCPFMFQKLSSKWEKFRLKYGTSSRYEDEMTESKEIFEDQLNRLLTREYVEIFDLVMRPRSSQINEDADQMEETVEPKLSGAQHEKLSNLGIFLLRAEELHSIIICTLFNVLHWLDTQASFKGISLCSMMFKQLVNDGAITKEEEVVYLLQNVLCGLKELGEHELNQSGMLSLGLLIYDHMRPLYPNLQNVLLQDAGCSPCDLETFDNFLLQTNKKFFPDKKKRKENFKRLVSQIIGKNVSQHFKNDIQIKNLPELFKTEKPKHQSILNLDEDLGVCALFATEP